MNPGLARGTVVVVALVHGFLLSPGALRAAEYELVADANQTPFAGSSNPSQFVEMGGRFFFLAERPFDGSQIWRTDLSADGTVPITKANEGLLASRLTVLGDQILYLAAPRSDLRAIWRTNGEPGGAEQVASLPPGRYSEFVRFGEWVWFTVENRIGNRTELWRTDGHTAEVFLEANKQFSVPDNAIRALQSQMLFVWRSDENRDELWRTDGSIGGTYVVSELAPDSEVVSPRPGLGAAAGDTVVFPAAAPNWKLYRTDGTSEGTAAVMDIDIDFPLPMAAVGERAFFATNDGLWLTDIAEGSPQEIFVDGLDSIWEFPIPIAAGVLVFGNDGERNAGLWFVGSDQPSSVRLIEWAEPVGPSYAARIGDNAVVAIPDQDGSGIYVTDGTKVGTEAIGPATGEGGQGIVGFGGIALFSYDVGGAGQEPWVSDGTPDGTRSISNIARDDNTFGSFPSELTWAGGSLFFAGGIGGRETWRWNERIGVFLVHEVRTNRRLQRQIEALNDVAIVFDDPLFRIGQEGVAEPLERPFSPGFAAGLVVALDRLFYNKGGLLFSTDGEPATEVILGRAHESGGVPVGNTMLYVSDHPDAGEELWTTDGSAAGTRILEDITKGPMGSQPFGLTPIRSGAVFGTADSGTWTLRFWDGSIGSRTRPILELTRNDGDNGPDDFAVVGTGAYFRVERTLWWTDGTVGGTRPVRSIEEGSFFGSLRPNQLGARTAALDRSGDGQTMVFVAYTPETGSELWATDGTAKGTELVEDIFPGETSSSPASFVTDGRVAYFIATAPDTGREIWRTDGTTDGTFHLEEFRPGHLDGRISFLSLRGRDLYFAGDDGRSGNEVWRIRLPPCPGDCNGDGRVTVSEAVLAVGIALGQTQAEVCTAADENRDGIISISELVRAVSSLLDRC